MVVRAVRRHPLALYHAAESLKADKDFLQSCLCTPKELGSAL